MNAISKKRWFLAHNLGRFFGPEGGTLCNGLYGKVEWYMKGYGVGPRGGAFPHKSLVEYPPPPLPHRVLKISVKSMLNYCNFYEVKRGGWPQTVSPPPPPFSPSIQSLLTSCGSGTELATGKSCVKTERKRTVSRVVNPNNTNLNHSHSEYWPPSE